MTSVRATEERPGADPLRPHPDLLVPSSSSSLRPGSNSTLAHPLWANDQDSTSTPLRFGSIAPSATPASSSSPSHATAALSPATQVASLHRAAEVARWEWSKDHDVPLSPQGSPRPTTPVAAAPPTSRSTGIGLIDVSDDSGASSSETLSGGESTTTSTSTSSESFDADAVERAFVAQMEARTQSTPRRPRPRNAVSSTGGLQADVESWSRMVYDLGCAAGVVDDGDDEHVSSSSSSSARHTPPPPFLFGYTPGSRLFPHPWWARRYSGPAGAWLRSELLRRARDQPQPSSTAATQTPASAMANEWRRQSTAAAAATSRRGDDGVMLSFPSLDPQTRSGAAGTTFPAIRLEPSTSNEGTTGQPSAQAQPPPAAVPATSSTSVAVPSSTSASSFMTPGLFNPWRSPTAAQPTNDTSSVTSTSQLLANPPRPPRTSMPAAASNVDRSITAGVLELTAAVRAQQGAVGSGRPPAAASSAASRHEPLPESAFQVPDASEAQRREAAQTVARLASAQRNAAATAAQRRAEPPQTSSSSTTRRTGDQQQQQRRREGHGMTYLRHLRSSDGIDSTPSSSSAPAASIAPSSSSSSTPVQAYQLFPWYTPPALDLPTAEVDATPSTRPPRLADPDGDAQGADWYRGVRARQENAQEEAAALRGLQDPNGEAMALDDGDVAGVQGGMSLPPWRPRAPRPREGDDEDGTGRQGAARRQRNRTALVLATEDYDDDDQAGSGQRPQRAGSALNDGAGGGDEVATAGGWTLINPLFRSDDQQQQPHSPVREMRDGGSENTTNWLRGPNSTSPDLMPSTTAASPPTSLRSLRRPRRLRSLASEDIIGAAGTTNNDSIAASSASLPTSSVQDATPVRRAEHHGRRGTGAADNVRSMTIDELRDREERVHRLSLGGEAAVGQTPSHRASASAAASTPAAAASSPPSTSSPWLSRISQNIEAELQQRQEELRASQQRLGEELTRRRRHLDELRQRQGRIGRVLERTAEAARNADRAGDDASPASSSASQQPASDAATTSTPAAASLVRRRTLRDPAPAGLRAPRAVRLSQPASDPAPSSSPRLRRSTSSATLGEDKELEEREAALASSSSSSSSAPRALDDLALSSSPSSRSTGSGGSSNVDLTRRNDSSPCLITPEDQARLGVQGTRLLRALDELGQRCGAYQEAALQAHRQRLLTWAPQQPVLPTTAVPSVGASSSSSSSSSGASSSSYPLRFEPSRQEPQPSGARSILRHDQNGLRFNAAEGVDVVLRFLAALPPTSSSSNSATTSGYPTSRQAEDRLWAAGRQRLLQRGRGTGSPATDAHEAHNERRRALGMAPREREREPQRERDLERDARERERSREALPSITATPFGYMPITSINGGGPSGRTPWPQILARRPDLTAREYAVLSRFDLSGTSSSTTGGGDDEEDEQATPIQQPFSRASSLSALRSLSSEDIDVLRALVLRTTRGPGGFGAATSSRAAVARGSNARQPNQDEEEEDLGSSDEESFPATARVESTTAATRTRTRTSSTLPGPALPSLFPSRAIALSEEDVQAIRSMAGSLFSTTAEQATSSSQQGESSSSTTTTNDGDDLVLRLASMDTAMSFIRRRAEAIAQAGEGRSSSTEPAVADPLGPLFTLSSLSLSLTRRACATAATTATGSSSRPQQQQRHQPAMTLQALVFVSDEPITKDALREWEGKTAREVRQVVAASSSAGAAVGPGLAEEEEQEEADQEEWDEEADLGDPFALERRAASTARQHPGSHLHTTATTINNDDDDAPSPASAPPPHVLPRALVSFTFPGTSSSSGAQMTMTTSQNVNFDRPATATATANAQPQQARRRRPALPIGRYLAVKLLPTTNTTSSTGGEEYGEGASLDAAAAAVELSYVGARGWPAAGMSSVAGGQC